MNLFPVLPQFTFGGISLGGNVPLNTYSYTPRHVNASAVRMTWVAGGGGEIVHRYSWSSLLRPPPLFYSCWKNKLEEVRSTARSGSVYQRVHCITLFTGGDVRLQKLWGRFEFHRSGRGATGATNVVYNAPATFGVVLLPRHVFFQSIPEIHIDGLYFSTSWSNLNSVS